DKKIPEEEFDFLLESARLSPSSFGMEPWKFLVITNQELKEKLKPNCWNQNQIDSCSHLVVVLAKTAAVQDDNYVNAMFARRGLAEDDTKNYISKFKEYLKDKVMNFVTRYFYKKFTQDRAIYEWCCRQTYIASANMTTTAAMIGIDSCFIEGFIKEDVEKTLELDTSKEEVSLILTFGYRINEPREKYRLEFNKVVTKIS
ncbi:MAG: NAD(P)H-dependent oxidoreductase, partial [Thiovulaceae bacterium]|nr:NAD(P)H-dependent oxidoreductase [Sulfurimonadaceae bacterium]